MQLNDIIERYSVSDISKRTNIAKEDVEILFQGNFENITRVKALGFISILEREYKVDLSAFREVALSHYGQGQDNLRSVVLSPEYDDEKGGGSKLFVVFVLLLLGATSWYFFTQFDKKLLNGLLPFVDDEISRFITDEVNESEVLSIESVIAPIESEAVMVESITESNSVVLVESSTPSDAVVVLDEENATTVEENTIATEVNATTRIVEENN